MQEPFQKRITDAGTTPVAADSRYVKQIVITCSTAGQTVKIVEHAGASPLTLIAAFSPVVSTTGQTIVISFDEPVYMRGIDIVTTLTGTVSVWINFQRDFDLRL